MGRTGAETAAVAPPVGEGKLVVLLRREGVGVSTSMVGRILTELKRRGRLVEAPRRAVRAHRRGGRRPYAVRKPKDYCISQPGDLVQVDTLELRPLPGVVLKHFTARAVICRWDVIEVHRRATASAATRFLDTLQQRLPFPLRALQVNGGSEPACGRQVRRRLRRGLPTAGVETVRAAAPLAQTQRLRRAGPAHPSGGVL